jgi:hypothetical protein
MDAARWRATLPFALVALLLGVVIGWPDDRPPAPPTVNPNQNQLTAPTAVWAVTPDAPTATATLEPAPTPSPMPTPTTSAPAPSMPACVPLPSGGADCTGGTKP